PRLLEPRDYAFGEELHRGQDAFLWDARADVHPDRELREADGAAQLFEPVRDALGRAVDGEILPDLVEAHPSQALADLMARPGEERLADRAIDAHGAGLGLLSRAALRVAGVARQGRGTLTAAA